MMQILNTHCDVCDCRLCDSGCGGALYCGACQQHRPRYRTRRTWPDDARVQLPEGHGGDTLFATIPLPRGYTLIELPSRNPAMQPHPTWVVYQGDAEIGQFDGIPGDYKVIPAHDKVEYVRYAKEAYAWLVTAWQMFVERTYTQEGE